MVAIGVCDTALIINMIKKQCELKVHLRSSELLTLYKLYITEKIPYMEQNYI